MTPELKKQRKEDYSSICHSRITGGPKMHHGTLNSLKRRVLMRNNSCQPKHGKKKRTTQYLKATDPKPRSQAWKQSRETT